MRRTPTGLATSFRPGRSHALRVLASVLALVASTAMPALGYPIITLTPVNGSYPVGYQVLVRAEFCEPNGYFDASGQVTLNGNVVANASPGSRGGCLDFQSAQVYVTLDNDTNVIAASISSTNGYAEDQRTYTTPPDAPGIGLSPHNDHNWSATACEVSCFNTVATFSTPAYWSIDQARSATLMYSSGQLGDLHTIQVDAWNLASVAPEKMSLMLKRSNGTNVTFTNGSTELYFSGLEGVQRLAGQFRDTTLATGAYYYTVVVRGYWSGNAQERTTPLRLLVLNERASPYGAGWSVTGLSRIVVGPGDSLVVTDGAGGIEFWPRTGCVSGVCHYAPPAGTFDSLDSHGPYGDDLSHYRPYRRRFVDGSSAYFNVDGRLAEAQDRFGNLTRFVWSYPQRLDSIIDPASKAIAFSYDGNGRLASIRDVPGNRTTSFTVSSSNNLTQIQDPVGGTPFQQASYDASHRLQSRSDRRGAQWSYYYDFAGKIASDSTPAVTVADTANRRLGTRYRSPESAVLIDSASGLGSWSAPATPKTDSAGIGAVTPSGSATRVIRVDSYGGLLDVLRPTQAYSHYTRNEHGQLQAAADSTGSFAFGWSGPWRTSETNSVTNQTATTEWNTTFGLVTRRYGAGTAEIRNWYDMNGRLDSTRVGGEPASRFTSDSRGRIATVTDPRGHTTSYFRDGTSLLNTDSVRAGVRRTLYRYDTVGRVVGISGPAGQSDSTLYDVLNRAVRSIGPLSGATDFAYGDSLNVTAVTDAMGHSSGRAVNAVGWVTSTTDAAGYSESYMHDRAGHMIRWTNRRGQQTTFVYDTLGRVAGRGLSGGRTDSFEYHVLSTVATNGEGSDTLRLVEDTSFAISVRGGYPYAVRSRYDRTARETRLAVWGPGQSPLETIYQMDSTSRLRAVLPPGSPADSVRHNTDGFLSSINLHGAASVAQAYRPRDDLARVSYGPTALQTAFGAEFVHDSLGRVVERRSGDRTQLERYSYDVLGRLRGFRRYAVTPACAATDTTSELGSLCTGGSQTLVAQDTFDFDLVGNRTDSSATVDLGNRQRYLRGLFIDYDADGNAVRKYTQNGSINQYLYWDSANELDSVRTWSQGSWQTVRFGYDAFGQRVRKTTSAGTTYYVWAAGQVVAEYDGSGNLLRHYTYYAGTDQPHSIWSSDARHYVAGDGRGNVMGLFDSGGSTVEAQYLFSPFGVTESASGTVPNAVRFAGRELDVETGLYYNRARYYDPQLGRFVSEDPEGRASAANGYPFAGNDPVNGRDPTGRRCEQRWNPPASQSAPPAVALSPDDGGGYWSLYCTDFADEDWDDLVQYLGGGWGWVESLGIVSAYGHLSAIAEGIWRGAFVGTGTIVGFSGRSGGHSTGPHLHFGMFEDGQPIDPLAFLAEQGWPSPLPGLGEITSEYGWRMDPAVSAFPFSTWSRLASFVQFHRGVDLRAEIGVPVYAVAPGRVVFADWLNASGWTVRIRH